MKTVNAAVAAFLLAMSLDALANGYCDSRRTAQEVDNCYRYALQNLKNIIDKDLAIIMNSPHYSDAAKNQVMEEHWAWEQRVQANCNTYACLEFNFQGRMLQLGRFLQAKPSSPGLAPEACLDLWIGAYRQEEGDEVAITRDQIGEWEDWCSKGKQP